MDWIAPGKGWYASVFMAGFVVVLAWELLRPLHRERVDMVRRWVANLSLLVIGGLVFRWLNPLLVLAVAHLVEVSQFGLLNWLPLAPGPAFVAGFVLLDLAAWVTHWLSHNLAWWWRLHVLHHNDTEVDFSTTYRHHPLDVAVSLAADLTLITLLGCDVVTVLIYKVVAMSWNLLRHGNLALPHAIERPLTKVLVTPYLHRLHHSRIRRETNSNYGVLFSFWDRWFGTYAERPLHEYADLPIGLEVYTGRTEHGLLRMLRLPFVWNQKRIDAGLAADAGSVAPEQLRVQG
ncbi:MAG: sterol desaturase family protein [Chromatiales bacterium]|nr:sterol desaturase family protein [Chromatiales bacterium]